MTPTAIIVMILAIAIFWGGLAWSIARLRHHPELDD
ncbi:methionine/alanine import family NSS transporter small subunit [Aeromicrobium camelliae]|uniref:Methionine/alanine import family NSS transporter small subunit n=1 Tax=Aeromicrobium camelliae TaxID=1538144 RepID=A0A3N6W464_9ACTN|nr:methionine/alanine import family NSS transporter small subunit [Aeromicrobium camelliae]RQN02260.1 methionine/alanine import family NSS transporter small subunit [Aeromicrobium camelliae]